MAGGNATSRGVGLLDLLGIAFIVLKLVGVIDWEWWVVLAPLWGPMLLVVVLTVAARALDGRGRR